jgi:hypothetical protein
VARIYVARGFTEGGGVAEDGRAIAGQAVLGDADRTIVPVLWTCT